MTTNELFVGDVTMRESADVRSLKVALGAYIVVLALKLIVYFLSGVMALLAEALHT